MGLIKALAGAAESSFADQWKEFFYCESMPADVLVTKGVKRTGSRSSNTKGSDNVISSGSGIAVADGQCMIIVEQGAIVEVCAEPGQFTYDNTIAPSVFTGNLGDSIKGTFATIGKRFTMGGDTGVDQRIYYFNTKEILDNKFGTPNPIPFRVVDSKIGLDLDVTVRCSGTYSYKITDPLIFYKNVCGNVSKEYTRDEIEGQLKTEFISALQPAFAKLSDMEMRPNSIPGHAEELCELMNEALTKKWAEKRGISVSSVAMNPISIPEEYQQMISSAQRNANPGLAASTLVQAQADAMRGAANNTNGSAMAFMGMGMAQQAGGMNAQNLYGMQMQQMQQAPAAPAPAPMQAPSQAAGDSWTCSCGAVVSGKFCTECGTQKPAAGWTCSCGNVNQGKFCGNCGAKKPAGVPQYKCDKCGWTPEDPTKPPKFCPECGDPFGDEDITG